MAFPFLLFVHLFLAWKSSCYARDVEKKSFKEIAALLNRKLPTMYATYRNSQKFSGQLDLTDRSIRIPLDIFSDRKYAVLELIIAHLKQQKLSFREISTLLHKHYSTITTTYRRYTA